MPQMIKLTLVALLSALIGASTVYFYTLYNNKPILQNNLQQSIISRPITTSLEPSSLVELDQEKIALHEMSPSFAQIFAARNLFQQELLVHQLADGLGFEELGDTILHLKENEYQNAGVAFNKVFLGKMLSINPIKTLQFYESNFDLNNKKVIRGFRNLIHDWAWEDTDIALSYLKKHYPLSLQESIINSLLNDWHFKNNQALFAFAEHYAEKIKLFALRQKLTSKEPEQAIAELLSLSNTNPQHLFMLEENFGRWAKVAPQNALNFILNGSGSKISNRRKVDLIRRVLYEWSNANDEAALLAALSIKYGEPMNYISAVLNNVVKINPDRAITLVNQYKSKLDEHTVRSTYANWAQKDPNAATAYIEQHGLTEDKDLIGEVATYYSFSDSVGALDWAYKVEAPKQHLENIAENFAEKDLNKAITYFNQATDETKRLMLLKAITKEKAKYNPEEAEYWLNQHQDVVGFKQAQVTLISQLAWKNPQQAAEMISRGGNSQKMEQTISLIASRWFTKDEEASIAWVSTLPLGKAKDEALLGIGLRLMQRNEEQGMRMISQIKNKATQDKAQEYLKRIEQMKNQNGY